ncbi:MAG: NAD(P)/FAD-dependent oxidoreductase [Candidatus Latescibacteria bacterium]|nr:NAD(P)/FAD-dependent oxidoreductase [Candidatus Latescibacterota bacterium]
MPTDLSSPVIVAGAGPAGLCAAIELSRRGHQVVVYERHTDVGWRFSDGYQILPNFMDNEPVPAMLSRLGISVNFTFLPRRSISFFDDRRKRYDLKGEEPFGFFIARGPGEMTLDQGLKDQATQLGAEFKFGQRAPDSAHIVATGAKRVQGVSMEKVFDTDLDDTLMVVLDNEIAPGGFAYLFILEGRATLAAAVTKDMGSIRERLSQTTNMFSQMLPLKLNRSKSHTSSMDFFLSDSATMNGSASATGEAAGFQDFLFGLGIRPAMESGYLAAKALDESLCYDDLVRQRFGRRFEVSLVNRYLYELGGRWGYRAFLWAASKSDFCRFGRRITSSNPLNRLALPIVKRAWRDRSPTPFSATTDPKPPNVTR